MKSDAPWWVPVLLILTGFLFGIAAAGAWLG